MTPYDAARFYLARRDLCLALFLLSEEVKTRESLMSFTGFRPGAIRAAIDAAKKDTQAQFEDALGMLASAQAKAAEVPAEIRKVAKAVRKEAEDALQEFAEFTNGAPPDEEDAKTQLPGVGMTVSMTVLPEIPADLKGRGNEDCAPIHCSCGMTFLWARDKGPTVTCPECKGVSVFTEEAFAASHNGQAK